MKQHHELRICNIMNSASLEAYAWRRQVMAEDARGQQSEPVVLGLTKKQAGTLMDALQTFGALVPDGYFWTSEERRLWEKAHAILKPSTEG